MAPVIANLDELAEIGRGGFGIVYQARQVDLGRLVAVKVLPDVRGDTDAFGRFARECQALAALGGHPNIATVFGCGLTEDGAGYLSLELLTGGSLADRVAGGTSAWADVTSWGVALCGALETAHRTGITHRDIKPENVLFDGLGTPKLLDFGIAGVPGAFRTATGAVTLTLAHAAPEVVAGGRGGVPGDIYALASTLFAALAGGAAFVAAADETLVPMLARIATAPVPDLRPHGVPDAVCSAIERAMAKDPADRPASAEAFGMALRAAAAADGVSLPSPPLLLVPGIVAGVGAGVATGLGATGGAVGDPTLTGWVPSANPVSLDDRVPTSTAGPVSRRPSRAWQLLAVAALAILGVLAWHGLDAPAPAQAGSISPTQSPAARTSAPSSSTRPSGSPTHATASPTRATPAPTRAGTRSAGTPAASTATTQSPTPAVTPAVGPAALVSLPPSSTPPTTTATSAPVVGPPGNPRQIRVSAPTPVAGPVGAPTQVALTLRWLPPTAGPVPASYDLSWTPVTGKGAGPQTTVAWSGSTSQRITVPTPPAGTWYRWSVRSRSDAATSPWVVSQAVVPGIVGRRVGVARPLLRALGLGSSVIPQAPTTPGQVGHVLTQSVPKGTVVPPRTSVSLAVGTTA